MKRIPFFFVAAVLLLTGTASADLTVYEYVPGEKVTLDDATGNYWYWNYADFINMNYYDQIASIDLLGDYGGIAGGWHMATLAEMTLLFTYQHSYILEFLPRGAIGRFDNYEHSIYHSCAIIYPSSITGLVMWKTDDDMWGSWLGAWVTTEASVVPAPPSVVLATTGLLTGLLCMLGAKLRGRRR